MRWKRATSTILAAAALAWLAAGCRPAPPPPAAPGPDLAAVKALSQQDRNRVVSSRDLADDALAPGARPWRPEPPWDDTSILESLPAGAYTVVVFVHGYNTPLASAIDNGNQLGPAIRAALRPDDGELVFYTFTWRGDFGEAHFGRSETAADQSAPALADFLEFLPLHLPSRPRRFVVLAHSLGARVAMGALDQLWRQARRPWVDDLVLVQPAVPAGNLYVGTVLTTLSPNRARDLTGVAEAPVVVSQLAHRGKWADSIAAARHLVLTRSGDDDVLNGAYRAARSDYLSATAYRFTPDLNVALGTMGLERSVLPTDVVEINLRDTPLPRNRRGHSGIFEGPELISWLWPRLP